MRTVALNEALVQPPKPLRRLRREPAFRGRYSVGIQMQVKSFIYERSWYGTYHRQRFFTLEKMDTHVAKMLSCGWQVLTQVAHSGQGRGLRPFAKRDTITIAFRKP